MHQRRHRYIYIPTDTKLFPMVLKCSHFKVLEVFFQEPTTLHFIKEIARKVQLAPTSVRQHINALLNEGLIVRKKGTPFNGFTGNRENENFLFFKKVYNLYSLNELMNYIIAQTHPSVLAFFGSYARGEDVESSDIDIIAVTKGKREVSIGKYETALQRKINILVVERINKLEREIRKKVMSGMVLYGGF